MEKADALKAEIERYFKNDYAQSAAVELLLKKGYSEQAIKSEIFTVYPEFVQSKIAKSFAHRFSAATFVILSLAPLAGYFFHAEFYYAVASIVLLAAAYGYFKLIKAAMLVWIVLLGLLELYLLTALVAKFSGAFVNSAFTYSHIFSVIVFVSVILRNASYVYWQNEKYKQQYRFN